MKPTHSTFPASPNRDPLDRALLGLVDAGLAAVVLVAPFFMGGRQALGQLVLVALAWFVTTAWLLRQGLRREAAWLNSPVQWVLLAAVALVTLQIAPLPQSLIHALSPELGQLLPLWTDKTLGSWRQLSLSPEETRDGLALLAAYGLLALVVTQRIAGLRDIERLLRWLALATVVMAAFGLVQYLASNGKFFWFYQHPYTDTTSSARGAFTNRNHFAHFLGLGLGPLLWWVQKGMLARSARRKDVWSARMIQHTDARRSWRSGLGWLLVAMALFALLISFSRGGMLAAMLAACAYVAVALRGGLLSKRFAWSLAGVAVLVAASLAVHGYRSVVERLDDLASASLEEIDQDQGRRKIWTAVVAAISDFPLLGAGVGTHRALYPRYLERYTATDYTHAENGYLQLAEETGLIGVLLLVTVFGFCATWCWQVARAPHGRRPLACLAAIAASLVASAAHSCADFVWYVPSCVVVVALLAPCALHLARQQHKSAATSSIIVPRAAWLGCATATAALGFVCVLRQIGPAWAEPHWDHYRIAHRGVEDPQQIATLLMGDFAAIIEHDPDDARAHLAMAEAHLRQFDLLQRQSDNPMSLTALREAARAWPGATRDELHAWLSRAAGEAKPHLDRALWHTRRALALCPLHGQGYLYLAELSFLEPHCGISPQACMVQALCVRPYDGNVLFKAGEEAALTGDVATAVAHWKRAFAAGPVIQSQLIDYAAKRGFPLAFFTTQFELDLNAFRHLHARYRSLATVNEFDEFLRRFVVAIEQSANTRQAASAADLWLEAHRLAGELADAQLAGKAARRAIACDPGHFEAHRTLGQHLLAQGDYEEAESQLRWCQIRRPGDSNLTKWVEQATKGRIDSETRTFSTGGSVPLAKDWSHSGDR